MRCDCRRRAQIIKVYINTLTLICLILFGLCSHYFKQIRRSAVLNCRIKTEFLSGVQRGMCRPHVILLTKKGPAGSVISFGIQNMTKWKETKHTFKKNLFSGPKHLEFAESINVAEPHLLATKVSVKDEVVLVCLQKWNSGLGHVTQCLSCESSLHFPTSPLCSPEGPGAQGRSETMGSPCPTCMFLSYPLFSWTAWSKGQHNIQNSYIACKNKL